MWTVASNFCQLVSNEWSYLFAVGCAPTLVNDRIMAVVGRGD